MAIQRAGTHAEASQLTGAQVPDHVSVKHVSVQTERESNTNRAYREIRKRVLIGDMPPGSQYLEQELAEMLGMSRTPVREALIRLADERLVEVRPRHGARVLPVSVDDIKEIYELLAELESLAVRRLAQKGASSADLAVASDARQQMLAALNVGDQAAWYAADRMFHAGLVTSCGNDRLIHIVEGLMDQAHWARRRTIGQYEIGERSDREHGQIIEAIRTQDVEVAGQLVRHHRLYGGAAMVELLRAGPEKTQPVSCNNAGGG